MKSTYINNHITNFFFFTLLILSIVSIIRIGACLYLPAMPIIGEKLNISDANMGYTLTFYFLTFSIFTLLAGSLSDAFGRKIIILSGISCYCFGCFLCGSANSFFTLMVGRIFQSIGASMIPGTIKAMVRDAGTDAQVVSIIGWLPVISAMSLVGAPVLGGVLTEHFGWRSNFWFLILFSIIIFLAVYFYISETLLVEKRKPLKFFSTIKIYKKMIFSSKYILVMIPVFFCSAIQGSYLSVSPFIFMKGFKLTPVQFGLSNIVLVIGLFIGKFISVYVTKKQSEKLGFYIAGILSFLASIIYFFIILLKLKNLFIIFLAIAIFSTCLGIIVPIAIKSSITAFREYSGMAGSLQGCLLLIATAIGSGATVIFMKLTTYDVYYIFSLLSGILMFFAASFCFLAIKKESL